MSLLKSLMKNGARPAIHDTRRTLSYAQLYRASYALASQMQLRFRQAKRGKVDNPRVLYMTNRDVLHPMAQFATWHMDGVAIPVSSDSKPAELEYFLNDSQADIVITSADHHSKLANLTSVPIISMKPAEIDLACKSLMTRHAQIHPPK